MPPTLSSHPRPWNLARTATLASAAALLGLGVANGCGSGAKGTTSHGFGGSGTGTTSSAGTGEGTTGGGGGNNIFQATATASSGTGSGTGGAGGGGMVCDANPTTGPVQWAVHNTDDGGQFGLAVGVDGSGNILIAGQYSLGTTLTLGSLPPLPSDAHNALFVAKLSPTGTPLWSRAFPVAAASTLMPYSTSRAVAGDAQGNVYLAGDFAGSLTFGATTISSAGNFFGDAFVAALGPDGTPLWVQRLGDDAATTPSNGGGTQTPHSIAVHQNGATADIAVVGEFEETLDLSDGQPNGTILKAAPSGTVAAGFLAVFKSADGSTEFGMQLGDGTVLQSTRSVAFDPSGDLLVTGHTQGTITFPGLPMLTTTAMQAAFVGKVKGDGSTSVWGKVFGAGTASGEAIASDTSSDVIVTGDHQGAIDFGGGSLANTFGANVFVAKLDATGTEVWASTYGDSMAQHAHGIAVDPTGHVIAAGQYAGSMTFGKTKLTSAGGDDIWIAKLDMNGCSVWAKSFGDAKEQGANGLALDAMGDPLLVGTIVGTVAFGTTSLTVTDTIGDLFIAKLGP